MNCTAIRAEDGRRITLPQPVGLELKCTCSSPRPPGNANLRNRDALAAAGATSNRTVRKAHAPLFRRNRRTGFSCGQSGPRVMLSARSLGGALLDYEALPASYNQPDLQAIFLLHAAPYGPLLCAWRGALPRRLSSGEGTKRMGSAHRFLRLCMRMAAAGNEKMASWRPVLRGRMRATYFQMSNMVESVILL